VRERKRERERERERKSERDVEYGCFFKGMTGTLTPFSYLVNKIRSSGILSNNFVTRCGHFL